MIINSLQGGGKIVSRSADFLLIAVLSAVVFLGCKKERSFRGANPGDEIVFGGTAGSASGFRSSKTKGGDGDSSVAGALAGTGLDASKMESCGSYDSDADETFFFDWEDFEGGEGFGGNSSDNAINDGVLGVTSSCTSSSYGESFGGSENDVQTKTEYSGHRENVGGINYERIDWKVGDKVKIYADKGVKLPKTECIYEVSHVRASGRRSSAALRPFNEADGHGLMWDRDNVYANFYAVYPGDSPTKLSAFDDKMNDEFVVSFKIPKDQNTFTKTTSGSHTEVKPDMELAAMLAVTRIVFPHNYVQLNFLPLITTFRITIGNPSTTDDMTINKVSLVSSDKDLSGDESLAYMKLGDFGNALSNQVQLSSRYFDNLFPSVSVELSSVPGGEVFLPKKNGSTVSSMSLTLFALPLMHKGLQLKVNLTKGGITEDRILYLEKKQTNPYAPAEQLEFEAYRKYDINVGVGDKWTYNLEVSSPSISAPYTGGSISGWVRSYKTDGGTTNPASWWIDGYSETGPTGPFTATPPTWLTNFTLHGNGVNNPTASEPVTANVSAQTPTITTNVRTTALRAKSEVGTQSAPIDLSRVPLDASPLFSIEDGTTASTYASKQRNTANCYVVTRPGWYKIPVVYGNSLKNSVNNVSSYHTSVSGPNVLQNFIRHDGNAITNPWIKDNGINLDKAELLWQDQPNLVQNIQLESNKKFIVFHVSQSTIHEGNAVIALKASATGDIVWSWHIWVYGGEDLKSIKVKNNKSKSGGRPGEEYFNFLSENLGACDDSGESVSYPESKVWVKVSNGRKTEVIEITRLAGSSATPGYNSLYYQWGRKDPMLPSIGISNANKFWYDKAGTSTNYLPTAYWSAEVIGVNAEITNTIKHPQKFNRSDGMDGLYYNLWDTECNETSGDVITIARFEAVTKSVYDPCPPGFCLPPNGAFTGFTKSGEVKTNYFEYNVSGGYDKGWNFRTVLKEESGSETIFFPASGSRRPYESNLLFVGMYGNYWYSVPCNKSQSCFLNFGVGFVNPLYNFYRSFGYSVRPVKEI